MSHHGEFFLLQYEFKIFEWEAREVTLISMMDKTWLESLI